MDERWRSAVLSSRADPANQELIERAITLCLRARVPVPSDLFDRRRRPARSFTSVHSAEVIVELLSGRLMVAGKTPGTVAIPECRTWWLRPKPAELTEAAANEAMDQEVPGLSLLRGRKGLDASLPQLAWLGGMSHLSLQSCGVTDAQLEALPDLPHLSTLDLSGARLSGSGLAPLTRLPNLVRLVLDSGKRIKDYEPVVELPRLQRLSLGGVSIASRNLEWIARLKLTHLSLERTPLADPALQHVAGMTGLKQLILGDAPRITPAGTSALKSLTALQMLFVRLPVRGFEELALALPELRWLAIWRTGFHAPIDLAVLSRLSGLRRLELGPIPASDLPQVAQLTGLQHLCARIETFTKKDFHHLRPLQDLRYLHLTSRQLTHIPELFQHLRALPRLERVVLGVDYYYLQEHTRPALVELPGVQVELRNRDHDRIKPWITSRRLWSRWAEWDLR